MEINAVDVLIDYEPSICLAIGDYLLHMQDTHAYDCLGWANGVPGGAASLVLLYADGAFGGWK